MTAAATPHPITMVTPPLTWLSEGGFQSWGSCTSCSSFSSCSNRATRICNGGGTIMTEQLTNKLMRKSAQPLNSGHAYGKAHWLWCWSSSGNVVGTVACVSAAHLHVGGLILQLVQVGGVVLQLPAQVLHLLGQLVIRGS
ncbi:hypothetical protein JZ751_014349 [Albula glossodonta]|uniref:Uncharacterized protein n=1 Tax=Albula glossodonta TaxID=121402 RepID=A0A8T2P148_9TELE|nr:hypothetical protein JZ751_014349 [Albula glossodonta]